MILIIAIGNPLRRDDAVAHRTAELLAPLPAGVTVRSVHQLTPELAEEVGHSREVIFLDAGITGSPSLEAVSETQLPSSPLGHVSSPASIVALARRLYGFHGRAWTCAIPAGDFGIGEGLTTAGEASAHAAARLIRHHLLRR